MKIFSAEQTRRWDEYSIREAAIRPIDLMERAARACTTWLETHSFSQTTPACCVFCGKGNNGGDGLAIARQLIERGIPATVFILEFGFKGTPDFQENLKRLHQVSSDIHYIQDATHFHSLKKGMLVIDALFGSGLSRPLEGVTEKLVQHINRSGAEIISIDMPSGLPVEGSAKENTVIRATHTLSFQTWKPSFLLADNQACTGEIHILPIGLSPIFYEQEPSAYTLIDSSLIHAIYRPRNAFGHKGSFGHAGLIAGSTGMMGAAVLSATACIRAGAGKLTVYAPKSGYVILQQTIPEAMVSISGQSDFLEGFTPAGKHQALGFGPGIGRRDELAPVVRSVLQTYHQPLVVDADALVLIAHHNLYDQIPARSILTPHPGEFDMLFGKPENDWERLEKATHKAAELNLYIIVKGHYSFIACPDGRRYFNSTGNPGMATAGSGDVLTGILTALLAQGYTPEETAVFGTYLHGLAGDIAAEKNSVEALIAGDIIDALGSAFIQIGHDYQ